MASTSHQSEEGQQANNKEEPAASSVVPERHDDDMNNTNNSGDRRRTPAGSWEALQKEDEQQQRQRERPTPSSEMMMNESDAAPASPAPPQQEEQRQNTNAKDDNAKNDPNSSEYSSYEVPLNDTTPVASGGGQQPQPYYYSSSTPPHHQQRRRRPRSSRGGPHNTNEQQQQQQQQRGSTTLSSSNQSQQTTTATDAPHELPNTPSLPDRLTGAAVAGTWDVLRAVGGATLEATAWAVAPPLHVTRTVVLPQLWAAARDYLRLHSPQRLKDWYRIVSASAYHVVHSVRATPAGAHVRHRLLVAWLDLVECLSTDAARQWLLDWAATGVRAAEALHTPEVERLLQQLAIAGCRLMDAVAADGRGKRLLHDLSEAAWAVCALLADPETTAAVAEVTAYLCYALEVEQLKQKEAAAAGVSEGDDRDSHEHRVYQSRRRRERNRYQAATVNDRETLQSRADVTVEEAILSSLGCNATLASVGSDDLSEQDAAGSVPQSIVVEQSAGSSKKNDDRPKSSSAVEGDDHSTATSQQQQQQPPQDWNEDVRNHGIDLEFLRDGIRQRAPARTATTAGVAAAFDSSAEVPHKDGDDDMEDLHVVTTVESDVEEEEQEEDTKNKKVTDNSRRDRPFLRVSTANVGEGQDETERTATKATKSRRERPTLRTSPSNLMDDNNGPQRKIAFRDEIDPWYQLKGNQEPLRNPLPLEGESPSAHFERLLDEILTQKRKAAVVDALRESGKSSSNNRQDVLFSQRGAVRRPDNYSVGGSSDKKAVQPIDSVKNRWAAIRSELSSGPSREELEKLARLQKKMPGEERSKALYFAMGACVLTVVLLWGAFGCYGLYAYLHPAAAVAATAPVSPAASSLPPPPATSHLPPTIVPPSSSQQQEIVIRVVKEVVHVDADGKELGRGPWQQSAPTDESARAKEYERIAECVADVYS